MHPPFISIDDLNNAFPSLAIPDGDLGAIIALDAACQMVRDYTEQTLNLVRGDVWHYRGPAPYLLPELPVVQINSLTIDDEEVDGDDYYIGFGRVIFLKDWRRRQWDDPVVVDYDHGWAITEADIVQDESDEGDVDRMPSGIRMVALRIAMGLFQSSSSGVTAGMRSESLGAYSYTLMDGAVGTGVLSVAEKAILDRYRVKKVPVP